MKKIEWVWQGTPGHFSKMKSALEEMVQLLKIDPSQYSLKEIELLFVGYEKGYNEGYKDGEEVANFDQDYLK